MCITPFYSGVAPGAADGLERDAYGFAPHRRQYQFNRTYKEERMNRTRILLSMIVILAGALALALLSGRQARAAQPAALGAEDMPGRVLTTPTPPWTHT